MLITKMIRSLRQDCLLIKGRCVALNWRNGIQYGATWRDVSLIEETCSAHQEEFCSSRRHVSIITQWCFAHHKSWRVRILSTSPQPFWNNVKLNSTVSFPVFEKWVICFFYCWTMHGWDSMVILWQAACYV